MDDLQRAEEISDRWTRKGDPIHVKRFGGGPMSAKSLLDEALEDIATLLNIVERLDKSRSIR